MVKGRNASRLYTVVYSAALVLLAVRKGNSVDAVTPLVEAGMLQEVKLLTLLRSPAEPPSSVSGATVCSNDDNVMRDRKLFRLPFKKSPT